MNWLLQGIIINILWAFIVWSIKPSDKKMINQIDINKIKNYLFTRIIVFMMFSLILPILLINLISKNIISFIGSVFSFYIFISIFFQFLKDLNSFLENITIKKKDKCPKKKTF